MADWIKVEITSSQKIEVLTMADILDEDEHLVFGKLVVLWCWADANTVNGHANNVTKRMIDRVVNHKGFADSMIDSRVGWLKEDEAGSVYFPNFDRHNGKGAKKRATDARRQSSHRAGVANLSQDCHNESVTKGVTRVDKTRGDKEKDLKTSVKTLDYSSWPNMPEDQVLKDWKAMRTSMKAKVTQTVINTFAKEFIKASPNGFSVDDCLTECISRGWRGFKAEWLTNGQGVRRKQPDINQIGNAHTPPAGWED